MPTDDFGFWSLLPPLLAITLAIATRRVIVSLAAGVFVGALMLAGGNVLQAIVSVVHTHLWPSLVNWKHLQVFAFTLLMGAMVGVVHRSGGMHGVVDKLAPLARSRRGGQLVTWLLGLVIFFDDYANTLLLGTTMRPLADRLRISREKLAYVVDSTAAPVAGLAIVSTWVAGEIGYIQDGLDKIEMDGPSGDALVIFVRTIPYRFYVLWALLFVPLVAWLRRDFGPMLAAEKAAQAGQTQRPSSDTGAVSTAVPDEPPGQAHERSSSWIRKNSAGDGEADLNSCESSYKSRRGNGEADLNSCESSYKSRRGNGEADLNSCESSYKSRRGNGEAVRDALPLDEGAPRHWLLAVAPITAAVIVIVCYIIITGLAALEGGRGEAVTWISVMGEGDSYMALVAGSTVGLLLAAALAWCGGAQSMKKIVCAAFHGARLMLPALAILWLAWTLSQICDTEYLGAGEYLGSLLSERVAPCLLPTLVFVIASVVAFSTGTSWGTMAILTPLVIPVAYQLLPAQEAGAGVDHPIFLAAVGSVLAGAIFGDHCSPISDTTILSSQASGCPHMAHVWTQLPYAAVVGIVAIVAGTLPVGWGVHVWLLLPLGLLILVAWLLLVGRRT